MMLPALARIMGLVAALVRLNTDFRFTASTWSHCCSLMRMSRPSWVMPALLTRISSLPKLGHYVFNQLFGVGVYGGVGAEAFYFGAVGGQLLFELLAFLHAGEVGEGDMGAELGEMRRNGAANSFGSARDEGDFSVEQFCHGAKVIMITSSPSPFSSGRRGTNC